MFEYKRRGIVAKLNVNQGTAFEGKVLLWRCFTVLIWTATVLCDQRRLQNETYFPAVK